MSPPTSTEPRREDPLRNAVGAIAWEMENDVVSAGDRAALRRGPTAPRFWPAFWRIAMRHLEPGGLLPDPAAPWREVEENRWALILRGMATTSGLHRPGRRLGAALAEARVSEPRVLRLLRASDEAFDTALRATLHQLTSSGTPFDWRQAAQLVLSRGAAGERSRREVARDYYRILPRDHA